MLRYHYAGIVTTIHWSCLQMTDAKTASLVQTAEHTSPLHLPTSTVAYLTICFDMRPSLRLRYLRAGMSGIP